MAQNYMGTGISFPNLKAAMIAERKKSDSETTFLETVASTIEEMLGKEVTLTFKEHLGVVAPGSGPVANHNHSKPLDTVSQHDPEPCN